MFFDFSREQFISIDKELKLLKAYLEIEKMRFGADFKFHFNIDPQLNKDIKIPSMLLQPIVENAVNHGLFRLEINGEVENSI
ncbi:MAG: LytS/YehU family sensor histidine kinase [Patiriisocius sp.]|jgi:LytS/YehU family sensor histidine kinase